MASTTSRKDDHLRLALEQNRQTLLNDFDEMRLIHHSLHSIDVADVDLRTNLGPIHLATPFFINAMTGGSASDLTGDLSNDHTNSQANTTNNPTTSPKPSTLNTKEVNRQLAELCRRTGLAMATGSVAAALRDRRLWPSYEVIREVNPDGILLVNVNPNVEPAEAVAAAQRLNAQGIQVHLNSVQELLMPEGDRDFAHWGAKVAALAQTDYPLVVKETGFGMSRKTVAELLALGVRTVDVSGRGGTNFAAIENARSQAPFTELTSWGQSTLESLLEARSRASEVDIIASGGIRGPLDMVKSFVLGAKACGLSGQVLRLLVDCGIDEAVAEVEKWKNELRKTLALLGAPTLSALRTCDFVLSPALRSYQEQRGL